MVDPYYGTVPALTPLEKIISEFPAEVSDADAFVFRDSDSVDAATSVFTELAELLSTKYGRAVEVGTLSPTMESDRRRLRYVRQAGADFGIERFEAELRQLEILAQIERSGAVYRPTHAHVLLPSGDHADCYVRVADMFDDPTSVTRTADWIDHRVSPGTMLVGDTWTIMPLLQELSRRHGQPSASSQDRVAPPIHTFSAYPDAEEVRQTFERLAAQAVSRTQGVLAIISVVSSGVLLSNLLRLRQRYLPGVRFEVLAIVNADPENVLVESLCEYRQVRRYSAVDCDLCQEPETRPLVSIDAKRYFPSFTGRRSAQMITSEVAERHKSFWEAADRCNAIRLHSDVSVPTGLKHEMRHRMIAIDVEALLEHDQSFRESTLDCLAKFCNRCDVVVVPKHGASAALLDLARKLYPNVRCVALELPWGTTGREQLRSALSEARQILILDESVISGRTLRLIHRLVQDVIADLPKANQPQEDYQISAFAVIGRPLSGGQWTRLHDSLRQAGRRPFLQCYKQIFMPDSHCPWCDERDRIDRVRRRLRSSALFASQNPTVASSEVMAGLDGRFNVLSPRRATSTVETGERIAGLDGSIFLCGRNAEFGLREPERLTWHSLFGERLRETTTYAAVATAMHEVRLKMENELEGEQGVAWEWDWAAQRILTGYHDPLIQASFLRAARAEELRFSRTPEVEAAVDEAFFSISTSARELSPMLAAEHKWAAISHKYSPSMRDLILTKADEALSAQAAANGALTLVQPVVRYLRVLQDELLLPAVGEAFGASHDEL